MIPMLFRKPWRTKLRQLTPHHQDLPSQKPFTLARPQALSLARHQLAILWGAVVMVCHRITGSMSAVALEQLLGNLAKSHASMASNRPLLCQPPISSAQMMPGVISAILTCISLYFYIAKLNPWLDTNSCCCWMMCFSFFLLIQFDLGRLLSKSFKWQLRIVTPGWLKQFIIVWK